MPIFLLDENVHKPDKIIMRCAEKGIEVLRVHQLRLNQTDDPIIFDYALQEGLVFVTGNVQDFRGQANKWIQEGKPYAGAIWLQDEKYRNVEGIIRKIIEVATIYDEAEF